MTTASDQHYKPHNVGTASIDVQYTDGTWITLPFLQAFYDPNAPNLLSVRQMRRHGARSPDFIDLTWHHGASLFDLYDTGRDYVVHPSSWRPWRATPSAHSIAQRRPLLQPAPSELADKGTVDWMVARSAYRQFAQHSPYGYCDTDLYTDGIPYPRGNTQCQHYYSLEDPAEDHVWCGRSFWANPPFINSIIQRMLMKMLEDFWLDPNNTSYTVCLRKSPSAAWWPLTYHFQEIATIPAGTPGFFSRPRAGTYSPQDLTDAGEEGGADRVFIQGAPFDTIILFKDATTVPRIDPHQYLHACLGHYSHQYIAHLFSQGLQFAVPRRHLSMKTLRTILSGCGCAHCNTWNAKRPGPFNVFDRANRRPPPALPANHRPVKWEQSKPFQHIFADIWGPCKPPGYDESVFISAFKCPVTKKAFGFASPSKGGQHFHLQTVLDDIQSHGFTPETITFHTDCATEYTSEEMQTLLRQYRMRHETGPPYMHEFQAQIEVLWRDMQKIMNSTMRTYDAPLYTWPLAALHAINTVLNVMPNKHIGMDTPHLRYTSRHFDYTESNSGPSGPSAMSGRTPHSALRQELKLTLRLSYSLRASHTAMSGISHQATIYALIQ
ncbi:hypothetical protein CYMTET_5734 [Cymbomonas tetramitiformis]|uniref:Integrase catalytic domain-containing protein n=1 Tax=Cymbomonas tetramitiformis TaxID=36881 RepID=A0AAE0LJ64_9CHLO|nr:hypothetical protein CYMTET_5734 [Cymbomonas tetramitiformis]